MIIYEAKGGSFQAAATLEQSYTEIAGKAARAIRRQEGGHENGYSAFLAFLNERKMQGETRREWLAYEDYFAAVCSGILP